MSGSIDSNRCEFSLDIQEWATSHDIPCQLDPQNDEDILTQEQVSQVWKCPHRKVEGEDKCIFHLPVDKRPPDQSAAEKFWSIMSNETPSYTWVSGGERRFIGAEFKILNLAENIIRNEVDLRHAKIGSLRWKADTIDGRIDARGLSVEKRASFQDLYFNESVEFDFTNFGGEANFKNVSFEDRAHFESSTFGGEAIFKAATFKFGGNFRRSRFTQQANFTNTTFNKISFFTEVAFDQSVEFSSAEFEGAVDMRDFSADGLASFSEVIFYDHVNFERAVFSETARFRGTSFRGKSGYSTVSPSQGQLGAKFTEAIFKSHGDFENAKFRSADFVNVEAADGLSFMRVEGTWAQTDAIFQNKVEFIDADIGSHLDMRVIDQNDSPSAGGTVAFGGPLDYSNATIEKPLFNGMEIIHKQSTEEAPPDRTFASADLSGGSFQDVVISSVNFENVTLDGSTMTDSELHDVNLRGASLTETHLSETRFQDVTLTDAHLSQSKMKDTTYTQGSLSGADLTGVSLERATFTDVDISDAILERASLREASFPGSDLTDADLGNASCRQTEFVDTNVEGVVFSRADLYGADFTNARLYGALFGDTQISDETTFIEPGRWRTWIPSVRTGMQTLFYDPRTEPNCKTAGDEESIDPRSRAASVYATLESVANENAQPELASLCFRWRKDMQRDRYFNPDNGSTAFQPLRGNVARITNAISRYGDSPYRVLTVSGAVILVSTFFYKFGTEGIARGATKDPITDTFQLLYFSIVTFTTLGYGDFQPSGSPAQWIASMESLVGALLIALLVAVLGRRATR